MKNKLIKTVTIFMIVVGLTSCDEWLTLYPEDSIIEDEFWENASQVESVVMAGYRYMIADEVVQRMIWWGEMRSDNVEAGSSASTNETQMMSANVLSSNSITKWDSFYKVINICNKIIEGAPGVRNVDANFREDQLRSFLSEAITIRSLCYFYLVRTFGDVPLILTSSSSDEIDYNVKQAPEATILTQIIGDLQTAEDYAPTAWSTSAFSKGRITKNAVRALLADVYLWNSQYQNCINECDKVLQDKTVELTMYEGHSMLYNVFYSGNSNESIFELNFSNNGKVNNGTSNLYGNTNKSKNSHLKSTAVLASSYKEKFDYRGKDYIEKSNNNIFKYEGMSPCPDFEGGTYAYRSASSQANWIIYRLADIYLMKAEAKAELATSESDLKSVLSLVNVTYKRACMDQDSLLFENYSSNEQIKALVLEERRREFAFEGKRWFDLLRKIRRDGNTTGAWNLLEKKFTEDVTLIKSKLSMPEAWYLPINADQMSINKNLHQNAYYQTQENSK